MRARPSSAPRPLLGRVRVPGDKSISHRALIVGALAEGRCEFARPNLGADVRSTAAALAQLGVNCELDPEKAKVRVEGRGWPGLSEPRDVLDAGNSGTTMRLLLGICSAMRASSVLTGDESLRRRPMLRVVAPLRQMGATIDGRAHGDLAPLHVRGGELTGIDLELPVASAQVKSALLLAGLAADGVTSVTEPSATRDHTERMLQGAGVGIQRNGLTIGITGTRRIEAFDGVVPGDISSAMFLIAAAAIVPGSQVELVDVGLNPTRCAVLDVMREMGADVVAEETSRSLGEPIGTIRVAYRDLHGVTVPQAAVPALIDEIPALAVVASQAEGETTFSGASELRVKESDRIRALVAGLKAVGADAEERPDGLIVRGRAALHGAAVDSHGDHRIALAFAVAGLVASGSVRVQRWSCVETSFPEFLDVLGQLSQKR